VQELQVTPMGVIEMIYSENNETRARLGINVFNQVLVSCSACRTGNLSSGQQSYVTHLCHTCGHLQPPWH